MNKNTVDKNFRNQFLALVRKEFRHIVRDKWTMIISLILPISMLLLFGFAITTEVNEIKIAIIDPSQDVLSQKLTDSFTRGNIFHITKTLSGEREVDSAFKRDKVSMVISFEQDFAKKLEHEGKASIALITDGSDPNSAKIAVGYASSIISEFQQNYFKQQKTQGKIIPQIRMLYNPRLKGAYNFVPGVMGMILMLICAMMTSISIAREKEQGTMEVLLVSPLKPINLILAKTVPFFILSLINLSTILLISVFLLQVPIAGSFTALVTLSVLYILVSLSLGLLVSSLVDTQMVALLVSGMIFLLPVVMLSGMIFPVENMPAFFRYLSEVIPAKWYILAVKKVMIKGLGFSAIYKELGVLAMMAIVYLSISIRKFNYRLE